MYYGDGMKKTTVVIDEKLLEDAIESIGARSKKEAIEAGLKSLVRQRNIEALRHELGTFEMDLTLEDLERLRHGH
jgi:Arc/MetJ family transcription regulator